MTASIARLVADLQGALSVERLESYRPPGGDDLEMLTSYFWNMDLAEGLMPALHGVELALRNHIHAAMTDKYGTDMWFYHPDFVQILERIGRDQLGQRDRTYDRIARRRPITAGRLVAGFEFGFWVGLLSDRYQRPLWQPDRFALFRAVFPHERRPSRQQVHDRFRAVQELRNRVAHYEAIWHRPTLLEEHVNIHEAMWWISPALQAEILAIDTFPAVFAGRGDIKAHIEKRIGLLDSLQ